jgi:hypothetical protein
MEIIHGEMFSPDIIMEVDSRTLPTSPMATSPLFMALTTRTSYTSWEK